jgi:hypothetical protein
LGDLAGWWRGIVDMAILAALLGRATKRDYDEARYGGAGCAGAEVCLRNGWAAEGCGGVEAGLAGRLRTGF